MKIIEFIQEGGVIAYILVLMNIFGFTTILIKWKALSSFKKSLKANIPSEIISKMNKATFDDTEMKLEFLKTELSMVFTPLEKGLTHIKNISSTAPLLGLLGTVLGIFNAFEMIAAKGLEDPTVFANGIKLALVTTVIGMIVAIPHLVAYNYFIGIIDSEQAELENEVISHIGKK